MATQITVAVGANGEVLAAADMRDAARADRLDTEATRKQAKQAAFETADDDAPGRDNPKDKSGKTRDPAAHARKKKEEQLFSQFAGLRITYDHFPFYGSFNDAAGAKYMRLNFRGIQVNEDQTTVLKDTVELNLIRNYNCAEFALDIPTGYGPSPMGVPTRWGNDNTYYSLQYWPCEWSTTIYAPIGFSDFAVRSSLVRDSDYWIYRTSPDPGWYEPETWKMQANDSDVAISMNGIIGVYDPDKYIETNRPSSTEISANVAARQSTYTDSQITGWIDHDRDPIHETFLLPFTGEKCFVLVIYTDYNVATRAFVFCKGNVKAEDFIEYGTPGSIYEYLGPSHSTKVTYTRNKPVYSFPEGYEFPDFDFDNLSLLNGVSSPQAKITDAGADKIQQIYLYTLENGELTEVTDIPDKLRETASNLSPSYRNEYANNCDLPIPNTEFASYIETGYFNLDTGFPNYSRELTGGPGNFSWLQPDLRFTLRCVEDEIEEQRKYNDVPTRERSIAKGYGFGELHTDNHFASVYIDSTRRSFYDDKFFTPMVYKYLAGNAAPSMQYSRAATSMPIDPDTGQPLVLSTYVDNSGANVRFTSVRPVTIDQPHNPSDYSFYTTVPGFIQATHRCWNWNRPDMCWDELKKLGFGPNLIGTRPPNPSKTAETEE